MATITRMGVYSRLKGLIAELKAIERRDIRADDEFAKLGFTALGLRALARRINEVFEDVNVELAGDTVMAAGTLRELADKVWQSVDAANRA